MPYVLYTEAAEETATVLILESIVRHFVSVNLVLPFLNSIMLIT